ncbi:hypothetical protein [Streptomyces sp. NRRL F-5123]|uniref:hypothetical protein n=1 Tax=Streptomyces sp. NRRL F-5123 TaxID=1463856 RepID=UPI000B10F0F9|nr:hypothetical protein [Streptomyces sp. NRRL F-5123]
MEEVTGQQKGDPAKIASVLLAALAADNTPLRLALGNDALDRLTAVAEETEKERALWTSVSRSTDFET